MTLLSVSGLTKRFGQNEVLRGIDLEVSQGERIAILGASGSGKSTLLRCLNFMEMPDGGTVTLDGKAVGRRESELTGVRQRIGMVFQQFNLFPHMTALGNCMEAPCTVLKMPKDDARARAIELLDMVGLKSKVDHYPSQLSGGQQQRVAIARALAMRPKVMLFDEVTSALDPELCGEVLNVIRQVGAEHDLTMLMVTHQMGFARDFADRVCFFHAGKICEHGPPNQIFTNPQNERTRQFLRAVLESL